MKEDLKDEKLSALNDCNEDDHNPGYDIEKKKLNELNNSMVNISNLPKGQIKEQDGIKTKKRTQREYNKIWSTFIKKHAQDFSKYMKYGLAEINKIGWKKFIDYMDWRTVEDILRYRTDRIKVIPCQHCGLHFTTFQIDFGLCDECKKVYDLKHFGEICNDSDKVDVGSSSSLIIAFTYIEEFRAMYRNNLSLSERTELAATYDDFKGVYTLRLLEDIVGKEEDENTFLEKANNTLMTGIAVRRFESIKSIICSSDNKEAKLKRIQDIF